MAVVARERDVVLGILFPKVGNLFHPFMVLMVVLLQDGLTHDEYERRENERIGR